jgi:hypothetical protein
MSAILQLKLPVELQNLVRDFAFYSKVEQVQRKYKKYLLRQLGLCERLFLSNNTHYDYFYFKIENWNIRIFDKDCYYISQEINILSSVYCKECHELVHSNTYTPPTIMCGCLHVLVD